MGFIPFGLELWEGFKMKVESIRIFVPPSEGIEPALIGHITGLERLDSGQLEALFGHVTAHVVTVSRGSFLPTRLDVLQELLRARELMNSGIAASIISQSCLVADASLIRGLQRRSYFLQDELLELKNLWDVVMKGEEKHVREFKTRDVSERHSAEFHIRLLLRNLNPNWAGNGTFIDKLPSWQDWDRYQQSFNKTVVTAHLTDAALRHLEFVATSSLIDSYRRALGWTPIEIMGLTGRLPIDFTTERKGKFKYL